MLSAAIVYRAWVPVNERVQRGCSLRSGGSCPVQWRCRTADLTWTRLRRVPFVNSAVLKYSLIGLELDLDLWPVLGVFDLEMSSLFVSSARVAGTTPCDNIRQGIHRHQTPPRYRNAAHGSRFTVVVRAATMFSASRPLRPKEASSIKPEVHNVAQRRQRRTEPQPQGSVHKNSCRSVQRFQRYAHEQTDTQTQTNRQTDRRVVHNTHPYRGGVIMC